MPQQAQVFRNANTVTNQQETELERAFAAGAWSPAQKARLNSLSDVRWIGETGAPGGSPMAWARAWSGVIRRLAARRVLVGLRSLLTWGGLIWE